MADKSNQGILTVEDHVDQSDSIYALAVTKVVKTGWHLGTVRLVAALFFTVFLQLTLVGLLWQVQWACMTCEELLSTQTVLLSGYCTTVAPYQCVIIAKCALLFLL